MLRVRRGLTTLELPADEIEQVRSVRSFWGELGRLRIEVWMRDGRRLSIPMRDIRRFGLGEIRRALDVCTRYFVEDVNGLEELPAVYFESAAWAG